MTLPFIEMTEAETEEMNKAVSVATIKAFNRLVALVAGSIGYCPLDMGLHCAVCIHHVDCEYAAQLMKVLPLR